MSTQSTVNLVYKHIVSIILLYLAQNDKPFVVLNVHSGSAKILTLNICL